MNGEVNYFLLFTVIPLAILIIIITFWINHRVGKKRRLFDERYLVIKEKARSFSWIVTTITILIVWAVIIIVEGPGLSFFLMSGIWGAHMLSYAIGGAIASTKN